VHMVTANRPTLAPRNPPYVKLTSSLLGVDFRDLSGWLVCSSWEPADPDPSERESR
jgi:hypothetical protein